MKILHVTPAYVPAWGYGGPIETVSALCRQLAAQGHDVLVLTTNANGGDRVLNVDTQHEVTLADRLRVRYCGRWRPHTVAPAILWRLPGYVRWADVVHLTGVYSFPTIPTLLACRLLGKPLVWSPRGSLHRWPGVRRRTAKAVWETVCAAVSPRTRQLHVTSEKEARASEARLPGFRAIVVPNGVEAVDVEHRVKRDGALRLLYLGRLDPIKGLENLVAACARLASQSLPWSLTIAGPGDPRYHATLAAEVERYGLHGRVRFVDEVRDERKWQLFRESDVVVLPSFSENFGMAVAEALAVGVPVIASTGTPWRRVEEVGCGLWVDNDPESLARAISKLSRANLGEMGLRGRAWMRREFSWDGRARQMAELYAELARGNA